jgi:hypothetical protein
MTKNTDGHKSYMTQTIVYPELANGMGPALMFQGPLTAFQAYSPEIRYIAEVMDEYKDHFLTPKDPVWQISAFVTCELDSFAQEIKTEILLKQKISEDCAKQTLFAMQEENVRLMLYNAAVYKSELTEDDLSGEIYTFPKGEDPIESDNETFVWRDKKLENEFPYIITTRQVLTDYNSFYEIRRQIKEYNNDTEEEKIFDDAEDEENEEEYPDYYRPISEVDMDVLIKDLCLDKSIAKEAEQNIRNLQRPVQFIAEYIPTMVTSVENEDGKNAPDIKTNIQAKWKISAVESLGSLDLMVLDHFRDAMYALCILEETIIDPAMEPDTYHKAISDKNYGNHYSIRHNKADEIDRRHDKFDCHF